MWGKKRENISDNQVTNKMCEGKCSRCGECCGLFIPFNNDDITRIKRYVELHKIKQYDRLDKETQSFKAHCCFYDEKKKECRIYPVRPYACKDFRCDRKDWKKYRDIYEKQNKYNSSLFPNSKLATFDDMIYGDCTPILYYIMGMIPRNSDNIDKLIFAAFNIANRLDILYSMNFVCDDNTKILGKDIIEKYKK